MASHFLPRRLTKQLEDLLEPFDLRFRLVMRSFESCLHSSDDAAFPIFGSDL